MSHDDHGDLTPEDRLLLTVTAEAAMRDVLEGAAKLVGHDETHNPLLAILHRVAALECGIQLRNTTSIADDFREADTLHMREFVSGVTIILEIIDRLEGHLEASLQACVVDDCEDGGAGGGLDSAIAQQEEDVT